MTIIESVRTFIKTKCPCLDKYYQGIGVDSLGQDPVSYSIETLPVDPIIKKYVDGSAEKRFGFVFASKNWYSTDVTSNIENIGFFDSFSDWLDDCTREKVFPEMNDGKTPIKIRAKMIPYLFDVEENKAKYQFECELIYFQKG